MLDVAVGQKTTMMITTERIPPRTGNLRARAPLTHGGLEVDDDAAKKINKPIKRHATWEEKPAAIRLRDEAARPAGRRGGVEPTLFVVVHSSKNRHHIDRPRQSLRRETA